MTLLRDVWSDLVEKRLWPLAAALVIAMLAVPVVLARSGGDEGAPPPAPATAPDPNAAGATDGAEVVSLADPRTTARAKPKGRYRDPFAGAARAQAAATAAPSAPVGPTTTGPPGGNPAPSAAGGGGGGGGGSSADRSGSSSSDAAPATRPSTTTVTRPVKPVTNVTARATHPRVPAKPRVPAGMRVDVTWGRAGSAKAVRDLVRLGRLDGSDGAVAMLFGVRADHETAVFVLPEPVSAVGDGTCLPKPSDCQLLLLKAGESEFFDVTTDAGVTQYELDVDRVVRRTAASDTAARRWRHRESKLGRKLLFAAVRSGRTAATDFMYKSRLGVLVRQLPGR